MFWLKKLLVPKQLRPSKDKNAQDDKACGYADSGIGCLKQAGTTFSESPQ